jgi:CRISPR-associated protein Cas1
VQLFINQRGSRLEVAGGQLVLRLPTGVGQRFVAEVLEVIFVSKGIALSSDVLVWALRHEIDVVFVSHSGEAHGRLWGGRFGSIATIRRAQLRFSETSEAMDWVRARVLRKIANQEALALQLRHSRPDWPEAKTMDTLIRRIRRAGQQLEHSRLSPAALANSMRGWEGTASRHYFALLAMAVPEAYRFGGRSRRPAQDVFNAVLNYLYGILYARVERALMQAGLDPYIGIWHAEEYGKPVLTYDFIEPYRHWADTVTLRLCMAQAVNPRRDTLRYKGGLWLDGEGKRRVVMAFQEYLYAEVVGPQHKRRTRSTHLLLEAQELAQRLLKDYA